MQEEGDDVEYEVQTTSAIEQPESTEALAALLVLKAARSVADRDSRASRRVQVQEQAQQVCQCLLK